MLHFGPFGLRETTSPSEVQDGMLWKYNQKIMTRSMDYARVLWNRELDRTWIEPPFTTTSLLTLTKFEVGFSIIDITLGE